MKKITLLTMLLACMSFVSCNKEESETDDYESISYKVAVVMPLDDVNAPLWHRMADQMSAKLKKSQAGLPLRIDMELEWHDENTEDLATLAKELTDRDDIMAVIGAYSSVNTQTLAQALSRQKKTLISPTATSTELARIYAGKNFYWALSETDVTQCEILLHVAKESYYVDEVALVAPTDVYGQSFIDWIGFIAQEIDMRVSGIFTYNPSENPESAFRLAYNSTDGVVICAPGCNDDIKTAVNIRTEMIQQREGRKMTPAELYFQRPYLLFSDAANTAGLLEMDECIREFTAGVTIAADPQSGFGIDYKVRYGENGSGNEALFHDALMMTAFGLREIADGRCLDLNEAIKDVVATKNSDGKSRSRIICHDEDNFTRVMQALAGGSAIYDISGASSNLDFDEVQQTSVLHSIYEEWYVYNGNFNTISYLSSDGSGRAESTLAAWNMKTTYDEDFKTSISYSYPELTDSWALLFAGSTGWSNYRHQADVLNIYQILRRQGYPDDHIVLILADDLAQNSSNPHKGTVVNISGTDLYADAEIDYRLSELQPADIQEILSGHKSERLQQVICADSTQNILVFWSGHGSPGYLCWDEYDIDHAFNTQVMSSLLRSMSSERCYRKMLWLVETCFSASVAQVAEELETPGVMLITAANANETSKAYEYNSEYNTWMTNRFTTNLTQTLEENAACTYVELYKGLTRQTTGSHVTVLNNRNFDNLYLSSIAEFFNY